MIFDMSDAWRVAVRTKEPTKNYKLNFDRDPDLLEVIHDFDGVMSWSQIHRVIFPNRKWQTVRKRLNKLWQLGYIEKFSERQRAFVRGQGSWLGEEGAKIVADLKGIEWKVFRKNHWIRQPRWGQLLHDIGVNEFRINTLASIHEADFIEYGKWISEHHFRSWRHKIHFVDDNTEVSKVVIPDGYFEVWIDGYVFRLLLELDMDSRDNPNFVANKVKPGIVYINSEIYAKKFNRNAGRWLVPTTSMRKLSNLKIATEQALGGGASVFFFTTHELSQNANILTDPIWYQGGSDELAPLFTP